MDTVKLDDLSEDKNDENNKNNKNLLNIDHIDKRRLLAAKHSQIKQSNSGVESIDQSFMDLNDRQMS